MSPIIPPAPESPTVTPILFSQFLTFPSIKTPIQAPILIFAVTKLFSLDNFIFFIVPLYTTPNSPASSILLSSICNPFISLFFPSKFPIKQ